MSAELINPQGRRCLAILFAGVVVLVLASAHAAVICTAVTDVGSGESLKQVGRCDDRVTPASTFKIAISLMGYDSGFLIDEHTPSLPFRSGYADWNASWRTTTDPTSWIKNSVVWFSRQVTRSLGEEPFQRYVTEFHYGNADVSGDPQKHDGLTQAWLSSSLQISPLEQLTFLRKVVRRQLPIGARAYDMTSRITTIGTLQNGWKVHGKTGTGFPITTSGLLDQDRELGWFVGWATRNEQAVVFAYLIRDEKPESTNAGLRAREAFLQELPSILDRDAGRR